MSLYKKGDETVTPVLLEGGYVFIIYFLCLYKMNFTFLTVNCPFTILLFFNIAIHQLSIVVCFQVVLPSYHMIILFQIVIFNQWGPVFTSNGKGSFKILFFLVC